MTNISEDVLLKAIEESLLAKSEPGLEEGTITTTRVMERFSIGRTRARRILFNMMDAGKIKPDMIILTDVWGKSQRIPGFRHIGENNVSRTGNSS